MKQYIIEGIDRLGKSTLIDAIIQKKGYHPVIHYQKPKVLDLYENSVFGPEYEYQYASFVSGFELLSHGTPMIFDRFHLGEAVYSDLYRGYSGDYVFDLEKHYDVANWHNVQLILLTTSDFDILEDDGQGFDFSKKEHEQELFLHAFDKSIIPNKHLIDITKWQDTFAVRKSTNEILAEIGIGI